MEGKEAVSSACILYISTTWERPSRRDGPRRRSSATVLGKAYAVGDIARRIPLRSSGPLLVWHMANFAFLENPSTYIINSLKLNFKVSTPLKIPWHPTQTAFNRAPPLIAYEYPANEDLRNVVLSHQWGPILDIFYRTKNILAALVRWQIWVTTPQANLIVDVYSLSYIHIILYSVHAECTFWRDEGRFFLSNLM